MKLIKKSFLATSLTILVSCINENETRQPSNLIGEWQASYLDSTRGVSAEYQVILNSSNSSELHLIWKVIASGDSLYILGFSGLWRASKDTVTLIPSTCYKGDSAGTKLVNNCDEDFSEGYINFINIGNKLVIGADQNQIVLSKK